MAGIPLFCKSYHQDVLRVQRLMESIEKFNTDKLPVFVSVPQADRQLFLNQIGSGRCEWLSDEEIFSANPRMSRVDMQQEDPRILQQVIKSEFWRVNDSQAYLCMDSDSLFIRPFHLSDFLAADGVPYTVLHQSKELLQLALNLGKNKIVDHYRKDCALGKSLFNRSGLDYDFGPTPVIWSAQVWRDLATHYLEPRGMSFLDAIKQFPAELRWYGEALLAYQSIPLYPTEPLFRVYHTDWQYFAQCKTGETIEKLRENYLGVVMQSNWQYEMDYGEPQKSFLSRTARHFRRQLARLT
ncbi:MAG: DUF6492 family protein [Gallionellaceae bacterium]